MTASTARGRKSLRNRAAGNASERSASHPARANSGAQTTSMAKTSKSVAPPSSAVRNISRAASDALGRVSVRTRTSGFSRPKRARYAWKGAGSPQRGWCRSTIVTGPGGRCGGAREQPAERKTQTKRARTASSWSESRWAASGAGAYHVPLNGRKQAIRQRVWTLLEEKGAAAFPGARGRIPNFVGASAAAERLDGLEEWRAARAIKCNPDAPQRYVRLRALRAGKIVYMAVPRLREARCFWELDPRRLRDLRAAASIGGAAQMARAIDPRDLPHIDLLVAGSVA